jgi:hypothetical protein
MRICLIAMALVVCMMSALRGEERPPEIQFDAPEDWKKERIALPPSFAPKMKLQGTEEVRFAPGMFQPESDSFFSYMFVFQVQSKPELTQAVIQRELLVYYRGLATAVLKGSDVKVETSQFAIKLNQVKANNENAKDAGPKRYTGNLKWVEPFATRKPQTLHLEIDAWTSDKPSHNYLFVCVSPQAKKTAIWKSMRELRIAFLKANREDADAGSE